jgi:hypothetical protein
VGAEEASINACLRDWEGTLGEETARRSLEEEAGVARTVGSGVEQAHMSTLCLNGLREQGGVQRLSGRKCCA